MAKSLANAINSALSEYFKGKPAAAYDKLAEALKDEKTLIFLIRRSEFVRKVMNRNSSARLLAHAMQIRTVPKEIVGSDRKLILFQAYRLRQMNPDEHADENKISRNEIFHIPSHMRHKIKTQRYSIPGHPCLYLGWSPKVCWKELGAKSSYIYSRFQLQEGIDVSRGNESLNDLANRDNCISILFASDWTPQLVIDDLQYQDTEKELRSLATPLHYYTSFFALWPLSLVCSIPRLYNEDDNENKVIHFHSEYIIPQLLMQWTLHTDYFDAVCYRSTQCYDADDRVPSWNLAFPARDIEASRYCKRLVNYFCLTRPRIFNVEDAGEDQFEEIERESLKFKARPLRLNIN